MKEEWDIIIRPKGGLMQADVRGIWKYRDLILLFVKRDFTATYKQTVLGPLWVLLQPLLTALLYFFIFTVVARIPTGKVPPLLFYLCGYVPWSYFSESFMRTSVTFTANASVFGKVYFPRLVSPVSVIISSMIRFSIQMGLLVLIYFLFVFKGATVSPTIYAVYIPVLLLMTGLLSLACGLLFSALTTKYRDLNFLLGFVMQLGMYGSSVVFSYSAFSGHPMIQKLLAFNPMLWIIEAYRVALVGEGIWSWNGLAYAALFIVVLLTIAIGVFGKVEKNFMDTV